MSRVLPVNRGLKETLSTDSHHPNWVSTAGKIFGQLLVNS